ncbi:polysaccharide deacetylase family protein [Streptococcus saliviloxodontae]|uniref:Peptidoglycan/xylan/chitin deacetylase (PgdA/CDA1 family) n=1 Tax=Streptococcus saliviloxodontae TaxID=1349416 RepID=A0ABS2PLT7_9STRE|nr:polysaccharide deacetylase family protein [Streptococcus saliviloxodontae]MBM7636329.1 peptidoglycan/xylan/chitin deacetylase (PgdA/CDA1 family) [Streptococcus saliviloxodontae]
MLKSKKNKLLIVLNCLLAIAIVICLTVAGNIYLKKTKNTTSNTSTSVTTSSNSSQSQSSSSQSDSQQVEWVKQVDTIKFPILMYHAIHVMAPEESQNANLIIDPTNFESQIKAMVEAGYYFLTPEEAYKVLTENVLPNGNDKIVWLTFDDSLWDFYSNAYPIMKKYQVKATSFAITGYVQDSTKGYYTPEQMLEMQSNGMSIESHTVTHPDLEVSSTDTQRSEISQSDDYLQTTLNKDVMAIAYPAGRYSDTTLSLASNNYSLGVTTNEGLASKDDGLLSLNRVRMLPTTTADSLLQEITTN